MYNKKLINILLKILGWIIIVGTIIFIVSGFFVAAEEYGSAAEKAGFWFGYEITGLAVAAFFYSLLGIMHKSNNK